MFATMWLSDFIPLLPPKLSVFLGLSYLTSTIFCLLGMRLVSEEDQTLVWNEVVRSMLADERFPFHISRENVRTINGKEEAFYAALSTNYIAKKIDSDLMYVPRIALSVIFASVSYS